ncbi:MAG: PAS domain-containing sensor histidine kinase [Pseudomonadota bacterium]
MSKVLTVEELNTMAEIVKAVTGEVVSADKNPIEYLQRVRNFLENVIDKMPGRAYWMDANGVTLGCNNNLVIHGGFSSKADIIGKTNYELPWKSNADTYTRNDQQVMSSGKELEFEEIATLPNGTFATSLTHKLPLRDLSGKTIGVLGISLDITERKKLEEKLRVSQAREAAEKSRETSMRAMAGSIAHDMRTPLSAILMAAGGVKKILPRLIQAYQMAQEANLDVPLIRKDHMAILNDVMDHIENESQFALSMITSTLQAVSEGGLDTQRFENISMADCVRTAISMYGYKTLEDKDKVHVQCDHDFIFWGNKEVMMNTLFNLMKNSFHFIEEAQKGEITILLKSSGDQNYVHFKDTGPGMSADVLQHLFEPFFTHREGGTGLGLNFCKKAMDAFNGEIRCDSKEGEYTEFVMRFPNVS